MSFLSAIFPTSTGTAHNGPQPPAPPAAPPAAAAPAAPAAPAAAPASPLDSFAALWQTPTTADGKPAGLPVDPLAQPIIQLDPAKVQEAASKLDFTGNIPPERITQALSGDPAALSAVINQAVQNAVVGLTINQGNTLNQALQTNNTRFTSSLPTQIKKVQLSDTLSDNPVFQHPAVAPLVQALKQSQFAKNPNASVAEIDATVGQYLAGLATAMQDASPERVAQQKQQKVSEEPWANFL